MNKGGWMFSLFLLFFILIISISSATLSIGKPNHSIDSKYGISQNIIGWINISVSNENADSLIATFDPSRIPLELDPYYCLEIAIKVGNLEAVHSLFSRFEEKRPFFKEEMRSSIYMEVPYRPIFWLSLVCDSRKVPFGAPPCETYIKISQFLEEKLEIKSDYFHQTPKGNISKWEYVEKFCNDPIKKNLLDFFRN